MKGLSGESDIARLTVEVGDAVELDEIGMTVEAVMRRFGLTHWLAEEVMDDLARTGVFEWALVDDEG
tara:strand:- start:29895 stop:30095 length:201 start_codon:yes stop_codon:yes gene_type:complete